MPHVTVGMPTYKRAEYLKKTIPLVLGQTFGNFELIVCDDASPDETESVVRAFKDPRIRYHRNPSNLNIPRNLNRILELARGERIVMLHDHDIFHPTLLEKMVRFLDDHPEAGCAQPGINWVDPDGGNLQSCLLDWEGVMNGHAWLEKILTQDSFSCPFSACGMVPRKVYEKTGFIYDIRFGFLSDVDLWYRIALDFDVGYIREPLITCLRRDKDHMYGGVDWRMIRWVVDICRVNLGRLFGGDPARLRLAERTWRRQRALYFLTCALSDIAGRIRRICGKQS